MGGRMFTKTLFPLVLCLALSPVAAFAQDDDKPAPKKEAKTDKKESTKEKKKAPVTPRNEETALKEFKGDMKKVKEWAESQKKDAANPAAGMRMILQMSEKMSAVRTDGLPEDLATGFTEMSKLIGKMASYFEGAPEEDDEFKGWLEKKVSDAEFLQKMQEEMPKLGQEIETKGKELKEIGAKYGIKDELDFEDKKSAKDDDEAEEKDGDDEKDEKGKKEEKEEK